MAKMTVAVTKDQHAVLSALPANIIGLLHRIGVQFVADDFIAALEDNNTESAMMEVFYKVFGKTPPASGRKKVMSIPLGIYNQIKDIVLPNNNGKLVDMLTNLGFKSPIEPPPPPPSPFDLNVVDDFSTIRTEWVNNSANPLLVWETIGGQLVHTSSGLTADFNDVNRAFWVYFDAAKGMNISLDAVDIQNINNGAVGVVAGYNFNEDGNPSNLVIVVAAITSGQPKIWTIFASPAGPVFTMYDRTNFGRVKLEYSDTESKFKFYFKEIGAPDFVLLGETPEILSSPTPAIGAVLGFVDGTQTTLIADNFELHAKAL